MGQTVSEGKIYLSKDDKYFQLFIGNEYLLVDWMFGGKKAFLKIKL